MMERRLARFTAFFTCACSLFAYVAVWFLPVLEQRIADFSASIRQDQLAREERYAILEKMSGLEIMDYNTQQVQEQAEKEMEEQKKSCLRRREAKAEKGRGDRHYPPDATGAAVGRRRFQCGNYPKPCAAPDQHSDSRCG